MLRQLDGGGGRREGQKTKLIAGISDVNFKLTRLYVGVTYTHLQVRHGYPKSSRFFVELREI